MGFLGVGALGWKLVSQRQPENRLQSPGVQSAQELKARGCPGFRRPGRGCQQAVSSGAEMGPQDTPESQNLRLGGTRCSEIGRIVTRALETEVLVYRLGEGA